MLDGRRKMTDAQRLDAVERAVNGETVASIARFYDVGEATIRRYIVAAKLPKKVKVTWSRQKLPSQPILVEAAPPPASAFYDPSRSEIARLKAKGLGNTQIAALLRLPYRVIEGVPAGKI